MKSLTVSIVVCTAALSTSGAAQAALLDRGGGLIYDTDLNITWLKDANYAKTSGYDADGLMTWSQAISWAGSLVYKGYDNWRLPSALNYNDGNLCWGWSCSKSEMGHLFYEELGLSVGENMGLSASAISIFDNIPSEMVSVQYGIAYWTSTVSSSYYPELLAWDFETIHGNQRPESKSVPFLYSWAVHDGDIGASLAAPIPAAGWLLGSGLIGLIGVERRKVALAFLGGS